MQVVEEEPAIEHEQRLSEHDQRRVIQTFHTTVYAGAANVALGNRDVNQAQEFPAPFDTAGLMSYLHHLGLSNKEINELQNALREDAENQEVNLPNGPGRKVLKWLREALTASASKVGVPVATELITQAILHYFGL